MRARPIRSKFVRYVFTAGIAAIVDLGGFAILAGYAVAVLPAATLSFLAANVVNYLLSARFAFDTIPTWRRYPVFLASSAIGLAVNVAVTTLCATMLEADVIVAKIIGIGVAFAANFTLNAIVVFAR